jgi:hypothetical protein
VAINGTIVCASGFGDPLASSPIDENRTDSIHVLNRSPKKRQESSFSGMARRPAQARQPVKTIHGAFGKAATK